MSHAIANDYHDYENNNNLKQCCGSGSAWIQQKVKEQINKTEFWTVCTIGQ